MAEAVRSEPVAGTEQEQEEAPSIPARPVAAYSAESYPFADARRLAAELELAEPVAIALARRGYRTVEEARAFLAAEESHEAALLGGIEEAVELAQIAIDAGSRITVHGDYDVDGICATAILVRALRELGADCDWLIPDRLADGYGLGSGTAAALAERGTELLITVDCGVASPAEVASLLEAGIEVIVTDHHQPGPTLPSCPIVHPRVGDYPFPDLCGAAVAAKLAARLRGQADIEQDLDLVALATIADMVPLIGENRSLVRRGLAELRRARRIGLRELMRGSRVEPETADESDVSFRLAPRLNAAGRLYRADAGVELMLCEEESRAREIAAELDAANLERRETERAVHAQAEAALRELPAADREAAAIVVAGRDWHPGVVGIVASRLVERHQRPALVLSLDGEGTAKGSGRAPSGYDLLAGLNAGSEHLRRFGGHAAAAGVELDQAAIPALRKALSAHAATARSEDSFSTPQVVDAFVGAEALSHDVAEQLGRLGPFGLGNPPVKLLLPSARVEEIEEMGDGGRHARFSVRSGSSRARGVAFNLKQKLEAVRQAPHDLLVRLELNHWNGASEPRAVLADVYERGALPAPGPGAAATEPEQSGDATATPEQVNAKQVSQVSHLCAGVSAERWWSRFDAELTAPGSTPAVPSSGGGLGDLLTIFSRGERQVLDERGRSALARITELSSSGERVLVITSDAARRAALLTAAVGGGGRCVCMRCEREMIVAAAADAACGLLITDWPALALAPETPRSFDHVVVLDPPADGACAELAGAGPEHGGFLHLLLAPAAELALPCWEQEWNLRPALAEIYKSVGGAGCAELAGESLRTALTGTGAFPRSPETAARCTRILTELGIAELLDGGDARLLRVVSSEKTELDRSGAWRAYQSTHMAGRRFLEELTTEPHRSRSATAS